MISKIVEKATAGKREQPRLFVALELPEPALSRLEVLRRNCRESDGRRRKTCI